jgi:hypothetical protein
MAFKHFRSFFGAAALAVTAVAAAQGTQSTPPATVTEAQPSAILTQRATEMVELINGQRTPEQIFAADLLGRTPPARITRVVEALREQLGNAVRVTKISAESPNSGTATIELERGSLNVQLGLAAEAPHLISTMKATGG